MQDKRYEVTTETSFDEFNAIMTADRRTSKIDSDILSLIFQRIQDKAARRNEEEKHAADRHQRRAADALRSRIKRLEPPVRVTDTWSEVQPRLEKYEEYKAVESDELREAAFDKTIRRMKERDEDAEKDRESHTQSRGSRRDYDRDRDYRSGRGERRGPSGRVSRTPELDAYEADRRKAQADRERTYRKVSGISPSRDRRDERSDRDRYRSRDRDFDRGSRSARDADPREDQRERLYRTRGDPRGGRDELDYGGGGDTRSVASGDRRRRRDSDSESVASRSAKRYRRDSRERDRSRGSRAPRREQSAIPEEGEDTKRDTKQDEKAIHSGSEEGEIEEEE